MIANKTLSAKPPSNTPARGSALEPRWGLSTQTPIIDSHYRARNGPFSASGSASENTTLFYCNRNQTDTQVTDNINKQLSRRTVLQMEKSRLNYEILRVASLADAESGNNERGKSDAEFTVFVTVA